MKFYLFIYLIIVSGTVIGQESAAINKTAKTPQNNSDRSDFYPEFSWETVPVAFHFGKTSALMTIEEAKFVASKSNFICLEKAHAQDKFW